MSINKQNDLLLDFINSFKSLTLSTIDSDNFPFTSYAPFIKNENKYYIYISSIAKHFHTLNLNNRCSIFFIEDEATCENIFAKKRVVLQCKVKKLPRDTNEFNSLMDIFQNRHGDTVSKLKQMKDFYLHEITPLHGQAVFGFGKAYDIGGKYCNELLTRDIKHTHKN